MTTVFSLISLLVCIHRASASTSEPNTTPQHAASLSSPSTSFPRSTSSSSMSSSSSSSSSPLLSTMLNSTSPTSMISPMMSTSTFSNNSQSSMQSLTSWSTSIRPSSNPTSLTIIASSSTDSLSSAMTSSLYRENPNFSTSFEMSDMYIVETEEIWLSTVDPDIGITSALQSSPSPPPPLPPSSSTSYHGNASLPSFPTPPPPAIPSPPPSSSSGAMSEIAEITTPPYPRSSTSSSLNEFDLVTTAMVGNSTSIFASMSTMSTMSTTSHAINGSTPMSATQSMLPAPVITSSYFYWNVTSVVESYTVLMTASVDGNMSAPTSLQPTMNSTHMFFSSGTRITATPSDYQTPLSASTIASSSSILLNASKSDVLSAMPSAPISSTSTITTASPSPFTETTPTNATTSEDKTAPGVYYPVRCTMIFGGNCQQVLDQEDAFITNFIESISSLMSLEYSRISVNNVNCGSVVVDFTLKDTIEFDFAEDLYGYMDTGNISVPFDNQNLIAETIVFHNGPYAPTTPSGGVGPHPSDTPPVSDGDGGGLTFEQQQRLIYILIGVVVGVVVLLAIVLVVHHVMRKTCSKSTQSFDLQDEPCIKLTDFNMAHTCIPRPRSIYSSIGADGRFFRYDNQEDIGNPPGSPTSFMYADSQDIKEHYHDVIDPEFHDPLTSDMQNQQDFGRSGLPEWNLPLIDGAPAVSPDLLTAIESHHSSQPSTSSDTFRPPSTSSSTLNNPPVFSPPPPPAPPPPPPPPLPTPIMQSGTLRSRQSCDASSEMTDSSGDSNTLTKGSSDIGNSMMGIDNPLMTPEEDYDIPGPSTSGRMSKYVVR